MSNWLLLIPAAAAAIAGGVFLWPRPGRSLREILREDDTCGHRAGDR